MRLSTIKYQLKASMADRQSGQKQF